MQKAQGRVAPMSRRGAQRIHEFLRWTLRSTGGSDRSLSSVTHSIESPGKPGRFNSKEDMRRRHSYVVLLNDNSHNPTIVEVPGEIESADGNDLQDGD